MPLAKKNTAKKTLKKRVSASTIVVRTRIAAKDTLFPEKVAKAKRILGNTQFL